MIIFTGFLLWATTVRAEVWPLWERAGFMGSMALGASYELNINHALESSIGTYAIGTRRFSQLNLIYRYSYWNVPIQDSVWRPFQVGVFGLYSLDQDRFFLKSPEKYPLPGYYDETATRWGIEFATTLLVPIHNFGVGYRFRILDNGLVALYNNANRDLQYYISSGISLLYLFD